MKRILISGGAGFIGSNLTNVLLEKGEYHLTCIDNFDPFYPRKIKEESIKSFLRQKNYRFIEGDIRNNTDLEKVSDIDIIIHLAAKAGVRQSLQNPLIYQDVNVAGTQNLLEFARRRQVTQFVFASSSSVYGLNKNLPWNEDERLYPISPYACSKLSDEMLGYVYSHLYGIRFLALRYFTVYGPRQRPDLAISKFFNLIIGNHPIELFGNGETLRDYTYITDIVKGTEAAITFNYSNYEIINLGCNSPITLKGLIANIENICGKKAVIKWLPEQPGDVPATCADIGKAKKMLDYEPTIDLQTGLKLFHEWFISCKRDDN